MLATQSGRRRILLLLAAMAALGLLWIALAPGAVAAQALLPLVRRARPLDLLAAAICQIGVYACVAAILRAGLGVDAPGFGSLFRAGGAFLWANRALPGPAVAGLATLVFTLGRDRQRPVSSASAQAAAALFYLADYAGFIAVGLLAGIGLLARNRFSGVSGAASLPIVPVALAVAIILAGGAGAIKLLHSPASVRSLAGKSAHWLARKFRRPDPDSAARHAESAVARFYEQWQELTSRPGRFAAACISSFVMHILETATLVSMVCAFEPGKMTWQVTIGSATGYVAGNLAAIVSFLPAGLGFFEGAMGVSLHLPGGVSVAAAAAATLAYRALSVWLPLPAVLGTARQALAAARLGVNRPSDDNLAGTPHGSGALSLKEVETGDTGNGSG